MTLVNLIRDGHSIKPELAHDTIIIEPLVAPASASEDVSHTVENEPSLAWRRSDIADSWFQN